MFYLYKDKNVAVYLFFYLRGRVKKGETDGNLRLTNIMSGA
jgi:hypothetical protein